MVGVSGFQPAFKVWFEKGGAVFGEGLFNLLVGIEKSGSISGAAYEMGMSYRSAWGKIRVCEKKWGIRLVTARVGGDTGGGSTLTGEARLLLERFRELRDSTEQSVGKWYEKL